MKCCVHIHKILNIYCTLSLSSFFAGFPLALCIKCDFMHTLNHPQELYEISVHSTFLAGSIHSRDLASQPEQLWMLLLLVELTSLEFLPHFLYYGGW